ncbi:MAG: M24 family metallopeptidase [Peptococcaceae bacterium]|nr:M24 family metallopeptidase [Peptococcaceae bacterium]
MDEETSIKIQMIRSMLAHKDYQGVIVQSQLNLAWLTGGRFFVNIASQMGIGAIFIGPDCVELIVNNVEGERLWHEEGVNRICEQVRTYPWYAEDEKDKLVQTLSEGLRVANDEQLAEEFLQMRLVLTPFEQKQYQILGRLAGEVVERTAQEFGRGETEYQIAARMAKASCELGMEPVVCLVGGDMRAKTYRHPLPTDNVVQDYALLVLSARKWGLVASVSRAVHFGRISAELAAKQQAVIEVDAAMLAATRRGVSLGSVFKIGQDAYARAGFPGEWQYHHQGGIAGYQSREAKATPDATRLIQTGQALAWNPTIQGAKSEDTVLLTEQGLQMLTFSGNFPSQKVRVGELELSRSLILER